jgi:nitroimidazol reductase NimA-like FMN-containing flavoprotein (pyridoxamine 5'-phosphate oxidase superfamily)
MSQLEELTPKECWQHLRSNHVGRIGFNRGRGDRIHPVGYTVDGEDLILRTSHDSELGMFFQLFSRGSIVPLEIDELSEDASERWSVLVSGRLRPATGEERFTDDTPDGHTEVRMRLAPVQVTGRRLGPDSTVRPGADT